MSFFGPTDPLYDFYVKISVYLELEDIKARLQSGNTELTIKESKNGFGQGVFVEQDVKAGTIFHKYDSNLFVKINDLAYNSNNEDTYYTNENLEKYTNMAILKNNKESNEIFQMFGISDPEMNGIYFICIKDMKKGDELSRVYGLSYWQEHNFIKKYPDNGFITKGLEDDLPPEWIFIDKVRQGLQYNHNHSLYGKKVDGKYYYAYSYSNKKINPPEDKLIDISKTDNTMYAPYEYLNNIGYRDTYMMQNREKLEREHKEMMDMIDNTDKKTLEENEWPEGLLCKLDPKTGEVQLAPKV